jgi:hypothetical protein
MAYAHNIQENLALLGIINTILDIYLNLSIQNSISIYIKGEVDLMGGFLRNFETFGPKRQRVVWVLNI